MLRFFRRKSAPAESAPLHPEPPSSHETPASLAALQRSRRQAWRAGIFVVITMFVAMLILLLGGYLIVTYK